MRTPFENGTFKRQKSPVQLWKTELVFSVPRNFRQMSFEQSPSRKP
jgi:hypothetical protein